MASEVDICNLALGHIGDAAEITSIAPPDGSSQAALCKKFYPISRDECLAEFDWGFAMKRQLLAKLSGTAPSGWNYWFTVPNPFLAARAVVAEDYDTPSEYKLESDGDHGTVVLTMVDPAEMWYTSTISDTTKFPPVFVHGLSWMLASYLSIPITRDPKIKQICIEQYKEVIGKAKALDGNQGKLGGISKPTLNLRNYKPSGIQART
jgi:hypothetical protein